MVKKKIKHLKNKKKTGKAKAKNNKIKLRQVKQPTYKTYNRLFKEYAIIRFCKKENQFMMQGKKL